MRITSASVVMLARQGYGPPVSNRDSEDNPDDSCVWALITQAARALGIHRANGKKVRVLKGWPHNRKVAGWIVSVAPTIPFTEALKMAENVISANDARHFDVAWQEAEKALREMFGEEGWETKPEPNYDEAVTKPQCFRDFLSESTTDCVNAPPEFVAA